MVLTEKKNKAEVCSIQRQLNIHAMSTFTFLGTVLSILSSKKNTALAFFSVSWPVQKVVHHAVSKTILELLIAPQR